jgi:hypothetical protein
VHLHITSFQANRFVFINQSQSKKLEPYHGRAINLCPGDRLPYHGAFLIHEMRVRGYWPLREDRPISLPIPWPNWDSRDGGDDNDCSDGDSDDDDDHNKNPDKANYDHSASSRTTTPFGQQSKTFTPTNPFSNLTELHAMKDSFAEQPNWKSAVIEGETWEGTAKENVNKWRGVMGHHE